MLRTNSIAIRCSIATTEGRLPVIVREILRTCSNPHVAHAAVASIGGDLAQRVSIDAARRNLTSGIFAAGLVRRFSRAAGARDWEGVDEATRGADQPILSGLRYILEHGAEPSESDIDPELGLLVPTPAASCCQAWQQH
jgi:hypothetical protein